MSYWEDLDDQLRWLEPCDLNLEYMGVSHLDCVSKQAISHFTRKKLDYSRIRKIPFIILKTLKISYWKMLRNEENTSIFPTNLTYFAMPVFVLHKYFSKWCYHLNSVPRVTIRN